MHGAKVEGAEDTDWYGLFIEPPEKALGLDSMQHFVATTGDGTGNVPSDVDVTFYSLRKWAQLAAKGNPTILGFLFVKKAYSCPYWLIFKEKAKHLLVAKSQLSAFIGYGEGQRKRLIGEAGQKNVKRTALESEFGYDTKYAMHALRLCQEGIEFARTGHITYPRPNAAELIDVRLGKYSLDDINKWIAEEIEALKQAQDASPLPPTIDRDKVSELLAKTYLEYYEHMEL